VFFFFFFLIATYDNFFLINNVKKIQNILKKISERE